METTMCKRWGISLSRLHLLIAEVGASATLCLGLASTVASVDPVEDLLRHRLEEGGDRSVILVAGEPLCAMEHLRHFYQRRTYQPAWYRGAEPLPQAHSLIRAIRGAYEEGLNPADYHLAAIEKLLEAVPQKPPAVNFRPPVEFVDLDLLLTDAFLSLSNDYSAGRVQPEGRLANWPCGKSNQDLARLLDSAISSKSIESSLQALLPQRAGYRRLRQALAQYREAATGGSWGTVPDGPKLAKGSTGERVMALRNRLRASGDWTSQKEFFSDLFDDALQQSVHKFQQRHGLEGDGIVGQSTLAALNVSGEDRIEQIKVNMERWRWLTRDLEKEFILVNIANFELYIVENESPIARMRVVVGKRYRPTPVFASIMTHLVINPSWNVPRSIAVREMLPLLRRDPTYLEKENIQVFEGWKPEEKELDPSAIDWAGTKPAGFKLHFRQTPGPRNALGQLKFVFPNQFDVYMHDTPARDLFKRPSREFSHGCIRIERPLDLAEYVLRGDSAWSRNKLVAAIASGKELTVPLPRPLPVYILYATAWVDRNGDLQLRRDTYKLDELVAKAISVPGV
jgi:murein L,D-transpeptidase YcbB/YkuD